MRIKLAVIIMCLLTVAFACSSSKGPYRTALLGARPHVLDPAGVPEYAELTLMSQVCGRLLSLTSKLDLEGDLAQSWTVDPDGKVYTFQLQTGRHFPDGKLVSSDDVKFTLKRIADSSISSVSGWMDEVSNIEVLSKNSLKIELTRPNPRFPYKLAHPRFCILNADSPFLTVGGIKVPNSAGAYEIVASPETDVRLEVSHEYAQRAVEKAILVKFMNQPDAIRAFKAEELDDLSFYLLSDEELKTLSGAVLEHYPIHWTWMLSLNPKRPAFAKTENRRHFLSRINVRRLRAGWGSPGEWGLSVVPQGMVGYTEMRQSEVFGPPLESPFPCTAPIEAVIISGVEREQQLKDALVREINEAAGCGANVRVLPMEQYSKVLAEGSADLYIQAMDSISPDPLTFYDNYIEGHADNALYSRDSQVSGLYNALYIKQFKARSSEDYAAIQRAFFADAFGVPIGYPQYVFAYQPAVKHRHMNPFGMIFNRWFEIGRG